MTTWPNDSNRITSISVFLWGFAILGATPLSAQVRQEWAARYPHSAVVGSTFAAMGIAVDNAANVYVTGQSSTNSRSAYTTLKYDPQGNQLWSALYTGYDNGASVPAGLVLDDAGNVYVTGASRGTNLVYQYTTVKYSPGGNQLWVARYQGPGTNTFGHRPTSIKFNAQGHLCVLGYSESAGNEIDAALVKYDTDGNQLSVIRLDAPDYVSASAFAVDDAGNTYLGGSVFEGSISLFLIVKYDDQGNKIWTARYAGPDGWGAALVAMTLDQHGNVYVTGSSFEFFLGGAFFTTVKYDPDGQQLWASYHHGAIYWDSIVNVIAVDAVGNVFVSGHPQYFRGDVDELDGLTTVKYDRDGHELWAATYFTTSHDATVSNLLIDNEGNAYVVGDAVGADISSGHDYTVIKYDRNGNRVWLALYDGPGSTPHHLADAPRAAVLDNAGNLYVTGESSSETTMDFATVKYESTNLVGRPVITSPPQGQTITVGDDVVFSVSADGVPPFSYQWLRNGFEIPGATNSVLALTNVVISEWSAFSRATGADYSVIVTNAVGLTVTPEARLIVNKSFRLRPRINGQALSLELLVRGPGCYSIESSTDLTNWTVIRTFLMESDLDTIVIADDVMSGPGATFYRARLEL